MGRIISYRGKLADGGQDTINLHTNDGKTGYKIVKFQLMPPAPGTAHAEWIAKIYTIKQTTVDGLVNFSDTTIVGVNYFVDNPNTTSPVSIVTIFDKMVFNQDIFITLSEVNGSESCNYYIELEQVPLTEDQALVAIVKNLRNEQ